MKLLFFDLDQTIYWDQRISDKTLEAMRRVQAAGNKLILDTGRSMAYLPDNVRGPLRWDGFILGMNNVILDGETLCDEILDEEQVRALYDFCEEHDAFCKFEGEKALYMLNFSEEHVRYHQRQQELYPELDWRVMTRDLIPRWRELRITKAMLGSLKGNNVLKLPGMYAIDFGTYAEVYLNGYDKSSGMRMIGEKLGLGREDMIAFGDSLNDLGMMRYAGTRVVMDHAPQEMLDIADVLMKSGSDGVAQGIAVLFPELF